MGQYALQLGQELRAQIALALLEAGIGVIGHTGLRDHGTFLSREDVAPLGKVSMGRIPLLENNWTMTGARPFRIGPCASNMAGKRDLPCESIASDRATGYRIATRL
ncbi:hypothetical protein GCM10007874_05010 [Labrys miyagiensis]|uniref:Uncharacterized protein n=1 Tax=Labrys miyagiensis TaxID=346912 RepID=A0ABQ6CAS6_9HYPH|nr:hypothetical protein GCM10007874_05010 [Labrys miyagiensis]